jgi:hypothetical protein
VDDSGTARHRRRRTNNAARAAFAEARRAGLVQRHILKLARLSERTRRTGRHRADVLPEAGSLPPAPEIGPPGGGLPEEPAEAA